MTIDVRPLAVDDYAGWRPLWDGYNAFYGRAGETALPEEVTQATWARFFDAYEPMHALVAAGEDGELLGLAHYLFHRSTTTIAPSCYLQDLFTSEAARGRGVGTLLMRAVRDRATDAGAGRLYWLTHESNAAARRLYDQLGRNFGFLQYQWPA